MISIENFYWILFQNLLDPVGLDAWYYFPFGTQHQLRQSEFKTWQPKQEHHVLFGFDQEPIWNLSCGQPYDRHPQSSSIKIARILANGEHSDIKKRLCQQNQMIDWYFFYHGFAALNWYRDAQYLTQNQAIKNAFLSLNHMMTGRAYRTALLARLFDHGIATRGSISFHGTLDFVLDQLQDSCSDISETSKRLIRRHIHKFADLPWRLDDVVPEGSLSARFGHDQYRLWQSSFCHVINETVFDRPKLHLTEKVFKPIVSLRPFILVAAPGNLQFLRSYGFRTFDRWIDESYDSIRDDDLRLDAISREIDRLARMHINELVDMQQDMAETLHFNKQHFYGRFREIIVEELVTNFDQCTRIWNNGRLDGREFKSYPDLESVKQILLR